MKLSDGSIVNTTIKFLGPVRVTVNPKKDDEVINAYFIFNTHKLYFNTGEEAETIRKEILESVPEAVVIDPSNTEGKFREPSEAEVAEDNL
jgi:endo-alpha-1,4-polygalactosaminidase (GH114 family)